MLVVAVVSGVGVNVRGQASLAVMMVMLADILGVILVEIGAVNLGLKVRERA